MKVHMSDYQEVVKLLSNLGILPSDVEKDCTSITLEVSCTERVTGTKHYNIDFYFTEDGEFVNMCVWE